MSVEKPQIQESSFLNLKDEIHPMIAESVETFRRDLPVLLKSHPNKWVAYHGDRQIGFSNTPITLIKRCQQRGLKREEFVVLMIEDDPFPEEIDIPYDA